MGFTINIEDLLNKNKVESDRIEFKKGWNPDKIFRSICAFANDISNVGGGYIIVGIDEEKGMPIRPVEGVPINQLDDISKDIQNFCNTKFDPQYTPIIKNRDIDGKKVVVIWVPAGRNRPYKVAENVTSKHSLQKYYVRNGSVTIEAKNEILEDLLEMSKDLPFDEQGNPDIKLKDINPLLVLDYLTKINSSLASSLNTKNLAEILGKLKMFTVPSERRELKNVAAMLFCDDPSKFFPYTQVDILTFPKGRIGDPNNFTKVTFKGPIHHMIWNVLNHLKTNLLKEYIVKPKYEAESDHYFNYPYQALEEAVVNSLFHRSYKIYEPVEITIEPNRISILNHGGPDRSISLETIKEGADFRTRQYRNRSLGIILEKLHLSEGSSTGIPTIQFELKKNGSGRATFETNEERTFFLVDIPCHPKTINTDDEIQMIENEMLSKELVEELEKNWNKIGLDPTYINFKTLISKKDLIKLKINPDIYRQLKVRFGEYWRDILIYAQEPISKKDILLMTGLKNHSYNFNKYFVPLLENHLLEGTEKDRNSPKQRYFCTELGKIFITLS